jgi:hypothetical protein
MLFPPVDVDDNLLPIKMSVKSEMVHWVSGSAPDFAFLAATEQGGQHIAAPIYASTILPINQSGFCCQD